MVLKGAARSNTGFFSKHLMNAEGNERVSVVEMRGFTAESVPAAFQELAIIGAGTGVKNTFYHLSINPDPTEPELTPEQWQRAVEVSAEQLGLSDQPRFVIQHEKNGRTHEHIIFSRIDADTMTAISDSHNYQAHDRARAQLEQEFNHERTPDTPEPSLRKSREFAEWENWRGAESGIEPKAMKAEISALWQQSDSGRAFQMAVEEKGYLLAKGDRRDFVVIDSVGAVHSLGRRVDAKAADIRAKMVDLDRNSLMDAKEASAWMKAKEGEAQNSGSSDARILPDEERREREQPSEGLGGIVPTVPPASPLSPKLTILEKYALEHPAEPREYVRVISAQDVSDFYKTLYSSTDWQDLQPSTASRRAAWETEQARLAELDHRQTQTSHDPPAGEPPVEPVSFERATRGIDPPESFPEREGLKRDTETWLEFVTRTKPPDQIQDKNKSDEHEPELER